MPNTEAGGRKGFSRYDSMSDDALRQILREDALKKEGEGSDTEEILYIMEVLASRRKERGEGKSPEEALGSFQANYKNIKIKYEESIISFDSPKRRSGPWKRGLTAAAIALVVLIGSAATAQAFGVDVWRAIANWTADTFYFGNGGYAATTNAPTPDPVLPCASLQELLNQYKITKKLVPNWMPEGYQEIDARVIDSPKQRLYVAKYLYDGKEIKIRITDYLVSSPSQIEQSSDLLEVYEKDGAVYYIFEDSGLLRTAWTIGSFECFISGPVTIGEMKAMIDSI